MVAGSNGDSCIAVSQLNRYTPAVSPGFSSAGSGLTDPVTAPLDSLPPLSSLTQILG